MGDMTPENSLIVSKTRCSVLAGQVIRKPDVGLAETLWEWLNDGEEMLGAAEVFAIKEALNAAGKPARKAWLDRFGMKPDDLPAARRDEAAAFVATLDQDTKEGAGDDGPDRGGDAGARATEPGGTGDGAHGQDVGRTGPEPVPHETGEGVPAAQHADTLDPDRPIDARALSTRATAVLEAAVDPESIPRRKKTWLLKALRHALLYAVTDGAVSSAKDADGQHLYEAWSALDDIESGSLTVEFSANPAKGVTFHRAGAESTSVLWSELTIAEAEAEADRRGAA